MARSEFERLNFDPSDPRHAFSYTVLADDWDSPAVIASCAEQRRYMVVRKSLKTACVDARLRGLVFYRTLDMTHGDRSVATVVR